MPARSCMEMILHPFSAVINFQKEFANDVIENVKKQREVLNKHHREMALRAQELHLDEMEEKYKCCVCGAKGMSRDFEPPQVLLNAISEGVTAAVDIVAKTSGAPISRHPISSRPTPVTTPRGEPEIATDEPSRREEEMEMEEQQRPPLSSSSGIAPMAEVTTPALPQVNPREVAEMIQRAKREIVNAQKLKRLEERHKKIGSYHKDKGLMRIHETDIEAFSEFFQKPVRGFLCMQCHGSARKRLDVLTSEVQSIIAKAQVPFTRRGDGTKIAMSNIAVISAGGISSSSAEGSGGFQQPHQKRVACATDVVLADSDILTLRQIGRCGVCLRRRPTHFARRSVLFLCQYCCAIDRYYRQHAICINDEPMDADTGTLLEQLANQLRGDDEKRFHQSRSTADARASSFVPARTLFGPEYNLFGSQHHTLASPTRGVDLGVGVTSVLEARPDFSTYIDRDADAAAGVSEVLARSKAKARSTAVSLFQGTQLESHVDLFMHRLEDTSNVATPTFDSLFGDIGGALTTNNSLVSSPMALVSSSVYIPESIQKTSSVAAAVEMHQIAEAQRSPAASVFPNQQGQPSPPRDLFKELSENAAMQLMRMVKKTPSTTRDDDNAIVSSNEDRRSAAPTGAVKIDLSEPCSTPPETHTMVVEEIVTSPAKQTITQADHDDQQPPLNSAASGRSEEEEDDDDAPAPRREETLARFSSLVSYDEEPAAELVAVVQHDEMISTQEGDSVVSSHVDPHPHVDVSLHTPDKKNVNSEAIASGSKDGDGGIFATPAGFSDFSGFGFPSGSAAKSDAHGSEEAIGDGNGSALSEIHEFHHHNDHEEETSAPPGQQNISAELSDFSGFGFPSPPPGDACASNDDTALQGGEHEEQKPHHLPEYRFDLDEEDDDIR